MGFSISPTQKRRGRVVVVAVFLALGGYLYSWANNPSVTSGSIEPASAAVNKNQSQPTQQLDTDMFTTLMPDDIVVRTKKEVARGNILLQILASNRVGQVADQLGITVGLTAGDPLVDLSGVRIRAISPNTYQHFSLIGAPDGSIAFERIDGQYEKSIFWQGSQGRYSAVVVSGTADRSDYLDKLLEAVVANWQWR